MSSMRSFPPATSAAYVRYTSYLPLSPKFATLLTVMSSVASSAHVMERNLTGGTIGMARRSLLAAKSKMMTREALGFTSQNASRLPLGLSSTLLTCGIVPKASAGGTSAPCAVTEVRRRTAARRMQRETR
jgi:hypothetical protein